MAKLQYQKEGTLCTAATINGTLNGIAAETAALSSANIRTGTIARPHIVSGTVTKAFDSRENSAASGTYNLVAYTTISHGGGMIINPVGLVLNQGDVLRLQASMLITDYVLDQGTVDEGKYNFQFWWTYADGGGPTTAAIDSFTWRNGSLIRNSAEPASKSAFKNIRRGMSYIYLHNSATARTVTSLMVRVSLPTGDTITIQHFNFFYMVTEH